MLLVRTAIICIKKSIKDTAVMASLIMSLIARDYNDNLYVYEYAPKKDGKTWENLIDSDNLNLCEDMFLCVSWNDEEPQSIVELLKDCEKEEEKEHEEI